jgi:hypothetical protein
MLMALEQKEAGQTNESPEVKKGALVPQRKGLVEPSYEDPSHKGMGNEFSNC